MNPIVFAIAPSFRRVMCPPFDIRLTFLRFRKLLSKKNFFRVLDFEENDHLIDLFSRETPARFDLSIKR